MDMMKSWLAKAPRVSPLRNQLPQGELSEASELLLSAARAGDIQAVQKYLRAGADINATDKCGWTPLHLAVDNGRKSVVTILIRAGAKVNVTDEDYWTPLHRAAVHGHALMASALLRAGALVNAKTKIGWSPLYLAAEGGHKEVVGVLIRAGALVNGVTKDGGTALHMAAQNGHEEVVAELLAAGANIYAVTQDGATPGSMAEKHGHVDVVAALVAAAAAGSRNTKDGSLTLAVTRSGEYNTVMKAPLQQQHPQVQALVYTGGAIELTISQTQAGAVNSKLAKAGLEAALYTAGAVVTANPLTLLRAAGVVIKLFESTGQDAMCCKRKAARVSARVRALMPLVQLILEALSNAASPMDLRVAQSITDTIVLLVQVLLSLRQLLQQFARPEKAALYHVVDFLSSQGYKDLFDDLDAELQACLVQLNTLLSAAHVATQSASGGLSCATWRAEDREDHREDLRNLESQVLEVMGGVEGLQQQLVEQREVVQGQVVTLQQVADWLQQMQASNKRIIEHLSRMEEKLDEVKTDVAGLRDSMDQMKFLMTETFGFMKIRDAQQRSKEQQPVFLISRSQIKIAEGALQRGSTGSYGTVVEADRDGGSVALKLYNYTTLRERDQRGALEEALLLCRANHHNIVRCFGIVFDPDAPSSDSLQGSLVMEWVGGGSIYNWLQDDCPLAVRVNMLFQVSAGMRHLHQQRIIHGDLKPQNILVSIQQGGNDQVPQVKICDFGLARYSSSTMTQSAVVTSCTAEYTSPQRLTNWKRSYEDDVYAFGILIHFVVTSEQPYPEINAKNVGAAVLSGARPDIDDLLEEQWGGDAQQQSVANEMAAIAKECWQADAEKRPTFELLFDRLGALRTRL